MENNYIEFNGLKIDPMIFTQGFVRYCDISKCAGQCCDWGVYMDRDHKEVIMKHKDEIIEVMDENQFKDTEKWFEKELEPDTDFPSGFAIGTEVYKTPTGNEQCVFKDKNGFCSIQNQSVKSGKHKWDIKPKYCIMYPITVIDNVITYDDEHSLKLDYCGIHKKENFVHSVFEAMTEEIKFVFGEDVFNFMNYYFQKNYKQK